MVGKTIIVLTGLALTGCAIKPPQINTIYVPVTCQEETPVRPQMPTEGMVWVDTDDFVMRAVAEIERRQGYEVKLAAALDICKR